MNQQYEQVPLRPQPYPLSPGRPSSAYSSAIHYSHFFYGKWHTHALYLLTVVQFMIAIGLPILFIVHLSISHGGLRAPTFLVNWTTNNPRYTLLIIAIVSSFFSWLAQNLFSRIISFVAAKRSLNWSMFATIETLAALKFGSGLLEMRRPLYTLMTITSAIVLGLLTAGYTTLLAPLPITLSQQLMGWEVDFLATDASCPAWFQNNNLHNSNNCDWKNVAGMGITTCWSSDQTMDILTAGRSAIAKKFKDVLISLGSPEFQEVVNIYEMGGLNFYGSTGGVVPQGPSSSKYLDTTSSYKQPANSSLTQQGLNVTVSCQYINNNPFSVTVDSTGMIANVTSDCGGGNTQSWTLPNSNFLVGSINCPAPDTTPNLITENVYLTHFGSGADYDVIGNISCEVTGSIELGSLEYKSSTSAFSWINNGTTDTREPSFNVMGNATAALISVIAGTQTWNGNFFIDAINSIYIPFVRNQTMASNGTQLAYTSLLETMIQGVIEYEASFLRLLFTLQMLSQTSDITKTTNPCIRSLAGDMTWPTLGWDAGSHTFVAFIPVGVVGLVMLILFGYVLFVMDHPLPRFDPTSHVSLAVASSSGDLRFPIGTTIEPDDEKARSTSVKFEPSGPEEYLFRSKPKYPA
ncbi:hypothetical protein SISNIDRAFT_482639 [Sistotremastrum niveocremeum HHB9708]|uniref:Uncharacterized protein n=1 Tax=Sistotremastrum niveocremeum HHB9708 TaxID=1314777 RepID=A0A164YFA9_9AGAM|nr:hypothetical protein SISNIDRAFT_482639 [Sistotremastrum niveocremeum HHB9708]